MFSSIWNETSVSGEPPQPALPHRNPQDARDLSRQLGMRAAREQLQLAETDRHSPIHASVVSRPWTPLAARARRPPVSARVIWLGRKDSNHRIRDPKSRALPLGHAPPARCLQRRSLDSVWPIGRAPNPAAQTVSLYEGRGLTATCAQRAPHARPRRDARRPPAAEGASGATAPARPGSAPLDARRSPRVAARGTARRPPSRCRTSPPASHPIGSAPPRRARSPDAAAATGASRSLPTRASGEPRPAQRRPDGGASPRRLRVGVVPARTRRRSTRRTAASQAPDQRGRSAQRIDRVAAPDAERRAAARERTARRRPGRAASAVQRVTRQRDVQNRVSAASAAAASLLPPPRPACTGSA